MSGYIRVIAADIAARVRLITGILLVVGVLLIVYTNQGDLPEEMIGKVAGYINLVAYLPYFVSIFKGETRPSKVTWWIWTALEVLMSGSYIMAGAEATKWLPIASVIGMFVTAILSLKFGDKGWHETDYIYGGCCLIGIIIWIKSGNPVIALISFLLVDLFAAVPTLEKVRRDPSSEDLFAWVVTLISGIVNLFAIERFDFSVTILPAYNFGIYLAVVIVLVLKRMVTRERISSVPSHR